MLGCLSPVLNRLSPFLADSGKGEIYQFFQCCIGCKYSLVFGHLAKLAMVTFHGIGSINNASDMLGVLEIGTEAFPIVQ